MRSCESCRGPGPVLWDDPSGGRYLCEHCHSDPLDPFFERYRQRQASTIPVQERRAPVQGDIDPTSETQARVPPGTVSWEEHLEAWQEYHKKYPSQSAERIAERGGFGYFELKQFLGRKPFTWRRR